MLTIYGTKSKQKNDFHALKSIKNIDELMLGN